MWLMSPIVIMYTLTVARIGTRVIQYGVIRIEAKFWLDLIFRDLLTSTDLIIIIKINLSIVFDRAIKYEHLECWTTSVSPMDAEIYQFLLPLPQKYFPRFLFWYPINNPKFLDYLPWPKCLPGFFWCPICCSLWFWIEI